MNGWTKEQTIKKSLTLFSYLLILFTDLLAKPNSGIQNVHAEKKKKMLSPHETAL